MFLEPEFLFYLARVVVGARLRRHQSEPTINCLLFYYQHKLIVESCSLKWNRIA